MLPNKCLLSNINIADLFKTMGEGRYTSACINSFLSEVAFSLFMFQRCAPASIRLMDNEQFQFGEF